LGYFREAYRLSRRPALLYNIAVAADRLRHDREALEAFQRYLHESPADAPQRADAAARVAVLSTTVANDASTPEPLPGGHDDALAITGWSLIGTGGASLIAGAVFLLLGQLEADSFANAPEGTPWSDLAGSADRASWMRLLGWILGGAGVGLGALGLTFVLVA